MRAASLRAALVRAAAASAPVSCLSAVVARPLVLAAAAQFRSYPAALEARRHPASSPPARSRARAWAQGFSPASLSAELAERKKARRLARAGALLTER